MLRIIVPSTGASGLTFQLFKDYELPAPVAGADAEINGDLILKFEDEEEAIVYAAQLENLSNQLDDKGSPENIAIGDVIMAIRADEFVQGFM